jgi:hypothetical protein
MQSSILNHQQARSTQKIMCPHRQLDGLEQFQATTGHVKPPEGPQSLSEIRHHQKEQIAQVQTRVHSQPVLMMEWQPLRLLEQVQV